MVLLPFGENIIKSYINLNMLLLYQKLYKINKLTFFKGIL